MTIYLFVGASYNLSIMYGLIFEFNALACSVNLAFMLICFFHTFLFSLYRAVFHALTVCALMPPPRMHNF